jgi:hypothetical protein
MVISMSTNFRCSFTVKINGVVFTVFIHLERRFAGDFYNRKSGIFASGIAIIVGA